MKVWIAPIISYYLMKGDIMIHSLHRIIDADASVITAGSKLLRSAVAKDEPSGMTTVEMSFPDKRAGPNSTKNATPAAKPAATGAAMPMVTIALKRAIYFCPDEID